jgi:hypothetical protein
MTSMISVGEIQAKNIDSTLEQLFQMLFRITRWSYGRNYFAASISFHIGGSYKHICHHTKNQHDAQHAAGDSGLPTRINANMCCIYTEQSQHLTFTVRKCKKYTYEVFVEGSCANVNIFLKTTRPFVLLLTFMC